MNINDKFQISSVKQRVLEKIHSGQVKMHGHAYFAFKTALIVLGLVLVLLVAVFTVSFLMFILNSNGLILLPAFGTAGVGRLLLLFPWTILILIIVFVVLLDVFVRRFAFAYHQPIMYSALTVFVLILVAGIALAQTPLHDKLAALSRVKTLPLVTGLYHGYGEGHGRSIFVGKVAEVYEDMMIVDDVEGHELQVRLGPSTVLPAGWNFHIDDQVMIMCPGQCQENMEAVGIRKIQDRDFMMFQHLHGPIMPMTDEVPE